ncbi:MAG: class I SAM-dependent methyltransferase [Cyclobacteriaceae bacterium]
MKDHNSHKYKGILQGFFHQLLLVDLVRYFISRIRFIYFVKFRRKLRTFEQKTDSIAENTIFHNMKGLSDYAAVRPLMLIKPLSVIESLSKDAKILTIGPRTEGEIFSLIGNGFLPKNIRGLDLISYSPWVDLGDMHNMPYDDNSFDVTILGWVIAYSHSPELAAKEVVRVLKPGGIVAVGVEYTGTEEQSTISYVAGAGRQTKSVEQVKKYFENHVDHMYFNHDITEERKPVKGSVILIFSTKK